MWLALCIILLTAAAFSGCSDKKSGSDAAGTNSSQKESSALNAPADYLKAVAGSKQTAQATVDTASIDKAAELFSIDKGRWPNSIDEMVKEKYLPTMPTAPYGTKLQYDAKSGKVSVVRE